MNIHIVTERRSDAVLLKRLLRIGAEISAVKFAIGGNQSSAISLAATILISRPAAVALVINADTSEKEEAEGLRAIAYASLCNVASRDRFRVFVAVPEMETLLFHDPEDLAGALKDTCGIDVQEAFLSHNARHPRKTLEDLLGEPANMPYEDFIRRLADRLDLEPSRDDPLVTALQRHIDSIVVQEPALP